MFQSKTKGHFLPYNGHQITVIIETVSRTETELANSYFMRIHIAVQLDVQLLIAQDKFYSVNGKVGPIIGPTLPFTL